METDSATLATRRARRKLTKRQLMDTIISQAQPSNTAEREDQEHPGDIEEDRYMWEQRRWPKRQKHNNNGTEINTSDLKLLEKIRWDDVLRRQEQRDPSRKPKLTHFSSKFQFTPTVPRGHPLWAVGNRSLLHSASMPIDVLRYPSNDQAHDHRRREGQRVILTLQGKAIRLKTLMSRSEERGKRHNEEHQIAEMRKWIKVPKDYLLMCPYLLTVCSTDQDAWCQHQHMPCSVCLGCLKRIFCHYRNCLVCNKAMDILMADIIGWHQINDGDRRWDSKDVRDLLYHQLVYLQDGPASRHSKYPIYREDQGVTVDGTMTEYQLNCWPQPYRRLCAEDGINVLYNVNRKSSSMTAPEVQVRAMKYGPVYFLHEECSYSAVLHARASRSHQAPQMYDRFRNSWNVPYSLKTEQLLVESYEQELDYELSKVRPVDSWSGAVQSLTHTFEDVIRRTLEDSLDISRETRLAWTPSITESCRIARETHELHFKDNDDMHSWTRFFKNLYCRPDTADPPKKTRSEAQVIPVSQESPKLFEPCRFFEENYNDDCCSTKP